MASLGFGAGFGATRSRGVNYGGSLRSSKPNAAAMSGDANRAAEAAMRQAESASNDARRVRAAGAYAEAMKPPGISSAVDQGPYDKPGVLGGGNMGLKPDLSEVERLDADNARRTENRPHWLGGFAGVGNIWAAERQDYLDRRAAALDKAYRDAAEARAASTWTEADVDAEGHVIEQNVADPNKRRVRTFEQAYKEEMEGPTQPGYEAPYREATRQAPVFKKDIVEQRMRADEAKANDDRDFARQMAVAEAQGYSSKELENLRSQHNLDLEKERQRGAQSLAKTYGELGKFDKAEPKDPYATPQGETSEASLRDRLARQAVNLQDPAAFSALPDEDRAKAYAKADEQIAAVRAARQRPAPPSRGGSPQGPTIGTVETRKTRNGGTVKVKYLGNGRWEEVG